MKLCVFGSKGWIGGQLLEILKTDESVTVHEALSRADDAAACREELLALTPQPTHVFCSIGRTHGGPDFPTIDFLEQPGKLRDNVRDNLFSPLVLAKVCQENDIHFTYLGTGCIFENLSENSPSIFDEKSLPNFFGSSYSIVKGFTDRLMKDLFNDSALNLRIRMPITAEIHPRNFITKITSYEKICSIQNSMTVLPTLLPLAVKMMKRGIRGTVNLTNPGTISHNEILAMYRDIVDRDFTWQNFSIEEQDKILSAGRSNNELDTNLLQDLFPEGVQPISEAVEAVLVEMNEKKNK